MTVVDAATRAAPDATTPAIELVRVTKRYGDAVALDDVSIRIEPGEFYCLLGPSGCGKTTTLNLIGGFVPLTSGELRIEGKRVNDLPPHKRNVNTVFQSYALFPHMTVGQNVAFGLQMDGVRGSDGDRLASEYLDLVGLLPLRDRLPQQLSGGQQQRVALARALVKRPAVLLLDEPLGALDLKLRKQMQVELARIHRQVRTTFVFVTHDQEEALSMATRIAVMNAGRVVQEGSPQEVYYQPVDRFVADFIGESNFVTGRPVMGSNGPALELSSGERVGLPAATAALASGDAAALMIRPECVDVGLEPPPPDHGRAVVRGRAIGVSFLGDLTRITVATAAGDLVASRPHTERTRSAALGRLLDEEVAVWWSTAESIVIRQG